MKWIIGALALGGLGGLAYLLMNSGSEGGSSVKVEKCEDTRILSKGEGFVSSKKIVLH